MKKYGITREEKIIYNYRNFKYDNLEQAVNYAVLDQKESEDVSSK